MPSRPDLRLDWCSHEAAKYAVVHWHYSRRMPTFKQIYIGVWEDGSFIGAVIFGRSSTPYLGDMFSLDTTQCVELTRIALRKHRSPVSKIGAISVNMIREQSNGLRLIVSYADPLVGHHGGIYQAMNWVYIGKSGKNKQYHWKGKWRNDSNIRREFQRDPSLKPTLKTRIAPPKYKYIYPLDDAMRQQIEPLRQPYPKRETSAGSVDSDTTGYQPDEGGATPTPALQATS